MVFSLRFRRRKVVEDPYIPNEIGDEKKLVRYQSHIQSPTLDDRIRLVLLTSLSLYARIVQLGYPAYITEIELEMSKQVNWYMAGKYFIGKFPPLSSLINTCLALVVGYYGNHDFVYAGQHFSNFPLVGMRKVSAIVGALIAPVCYMTIRNFGHSRSAATFAAILMVFENGNITQSRYASPEIHSMFFGALATWSWSMVRKNTSGSAKWTGTLILPIIWCSIAFEMWNQLSDKKNSVYSCIKKVYVYLFTVGAFPFWIYMLIFKIHFDIASNAGDHDLILSSRFRYSLNGNHFEPSIAYGSQVVIKHEGSPGGFLHSHQKRFAGGSTQQEVTLYPYVDLNNIWTIHKATVLYNTSQPLEYVRNGDHIRLEHFSSSRKLHSHDERPQLTNRKEHHEVTAYGDRLTSDIQDYWSLVLLDDKHEHSKDMNMTWKALDQQFRLFHIRGCALISHDAYYDSPGGHGHQEVTCMVSAGKHVSTWTIESAYHEKYL
ncbi:hypothetical protein G6F44_005295 [Rhizopus delemar]|nr:hypothetical protein G6F44_005295 [Rhizopus delemar]